MERAQADAILTDLKRKTVLLSGPRQVGKTTLSRMLLPEDHDYLNYDHPEHRLLVDQRAWDRAKSLVVLDELHKKKAWKSWLKGIYDVEGIPPALLVTGSARLDTARKTGDSMAGRYFLHRLHPLDVKEVRSQLAPAEALDRILEVGGFPEPFLEGDPAFAGRWRRTHLDIILRQDLPDLIATSNIRSIETLIELLRRRVGATVSHANLARDLQCDAKTVKRWIELLRDLYVLFPVTPFSRKVARSLRKAPKYYLVDTGQVEGDDGARLENAVACALRKEIDLLEDALGERIGLHYLRTKEGQEVDFVLTRDDQVFLLVEVKRAHPQPTRALQRYQRIFPEAEAVQVVRHLDRERTYPGGVSVRRAATWLANLDLRAGPGEGRSGF